MLTTIPEKCETVPSFALLLIENQLKIQSSRLITASVKQDKVPPISPQMSLNQDKHTFRIACQSSKDPPKVFNKITKLAGGWGELKKDKCAEYVFLQCTCSSSLVIFFYFPKKKSHFLLRTLFALQSN